MEFNPSDEMPQNRCRFEVKNALFKRTFYSYVTLRIHELYKSGMLLALE